MHTLNQLPDFDSLYRWGRNIRLHGNRFIQIDIGLSLRLHIWSDILPKAQARPAPIHDHDYDFSSTILSGELINVVYRPDMMTDTVLVKDGWEEPFYDIHYVDRPSGMLVKTDSSCMLKRFQANYMTKGTDYQMFAPQIHASAYVGHAITCVKAGPSFDKYCRVFVPHSIRPDNEYRRDQYSGPFLWDCVAEVYSSIVLPPETEERYRLRQWDQTVNPQ